MSGGQGEGLWLGAGGGPARKLFSAWLPLLGADNKQGPSHVCCLELLLVFLIFYFFSIASGGRMLYLGVTVRWCRHFAWNPAVPLSTCMAAPVALCHGASAPPVMWGGWQCLPGRSVTRSHMAALRADAVGDCLQSSSMTGIPNTQVALLIGC